MSFYFVVRIKKQELCQYYLLLQVEDFNPSSECFHKSGKFTSAGSQGTSGHIILCTQVKTEQQAALAECNCTM